MHNFEKHIKYNIEAHELIRPEGVVIVAVSGGADSVALLASLIALGYNCVAAHCNFHLRGDESDRDMRSVQALCSRLEVDLYMRDFDVEDRCRTTGESVEMACRSLRYEWFGNLLDKMRAQCIAVAHHREDNVETFFLNLMRGSSITGLTGMRWRNEYIVRPILNLTRESIETYLADRNIPYVNDSSNASNDYQRNKLRNVVIPTLTAQFPGAIDGILKSIGYLNENRELYARTVSEKSAIYLTANTIHLNELLRDEPQHRLLLFEMLKPLGFNMSQVDDILASADKSGLTFETDNTTLELSHGKLTIAGRTAFTTDEVEVSLARDILSPVHITITEHPVSAFLPSREATVAYFDKAILGDSPKFTLRRWRRGDRITPFGMRGTRLLSDIFSDAKLSAAEKRNVWILTRNAEIIWVVGIRATDRFSVGPETRRFLTLTLNLQNTPKG